jgi:hypothetical protein
MESMKMIVEKYAAADEGERLHMFLTHRDLREEFTTIDMAGASVLEMTPSKLEKGRRRNLFADCCWGWIRPCRPAR